VLLHDPTLVQEEPKIEFSVWNLVIGGTVACGFYAFGKILNYFVPSVHNLAWMVLVVALCNVARIVPAYIISACYSWFKFVVKAFVGIVLLAIGVVFTDLGEVIQSMTPSYVLLCATVVVGSSLGAGLVGRMVGLYFIESRAPDIPLGKSVRFSPGRRRCDRESETLLGAGKERVGRVQFVAHGANGFGSVRRTERRECHT